VALCQARISTKPLWGFSSSNPYHSQSRAEQYSAGIFYAFCSVNCSSLLKTNSVEVSDLVYQLKWT
jgi:hypothetical protein